MVPGEFSHPLHQAFQENAISVSSALLFGSQARGDSSTDSDYDLLLVVPRDLSFNEKADMARMIRKFFAKRLIPVDVLIRSSSEVARHRTLHGSTIRNALKEGVPV